MNRPLCTHLRTKALYVGATPEEAFADKDIEQATPCYFWCNLTQTVVGVDDRPVHKDTCNSARSCFEA